MSPEEFALRRFIQCRLMNVDYMTSHSLKDIERDAKRRRYVEGFESYIRGGSGGQEAMFLDDILRRIGLLWRLYISSASHHHRGAPSIGT